MTKKQITLEDLEKEYERLEKEYTACMEADLNRQAGIILRKKHKISEQINEINEKEKFDKEIKKIKEQEMYGIKQEMLKELELYKRFIIEEGLEYRFNNFKNELEEEEIL